MSASPVAEPAPPVKGHDIIDHLRISEWLMTARELASILAISPKTIYSYSVRHHRIQQPIARVVERHRRGLTPVPASLSRDRHHRPVQHSRKQVVPVPCS